jgi:hypothetical protein
MSKSTYLNPQRWQDFTKKAKINENQLKKDLAAYENLKDDEYGKRLGALENIHKRVVTLKDQFNKAINAAKNQKGKPPVTKGLEDAVKYLTDVDNAVDAEKKEIEAAQQKANAAAKAANPPTLDRVSDAAQKMSGPAASRMKKVMALAMKHRGNRKFCWFYEYNTVADFMNPNTKDSVRQQMITKGGGKLPYTGDLWVVYPFDSLLDRRCSKGCPENDLISFLNWLDGQILYSVKAVKKLERTEASNDAMEEFYEHVKSLLKNGSHVYSAGY